MDVRRPLILCAEVSKERLQALRAAVQHRGIELAEAGSAVEVVSMSGELQPTAVILHVSLAVVDGWSIPECVQLIRSDVPLLLLVDHPGQEGAISKVRDVRQASDLQGITNWITKVSGR